MKKIIHLGLLAVISTGLTGCGGESFSDLQAYMDEVRSRPRSKIEDMPKEVAYEPFTYRATGLRSPFQPPVKLEQERSSEKAQVNVQPDETRVREFLENFNLESFVMVGTLANKGGSFALVRGGDGVHRVQVGDHMGRNHGRIVSITADAVELIEIVPDGEGGWLERPHTLSLQERS